MTFTAVRGARLGKLHEPNEVAPRPGSPSVGVKHRCPGGQAASYLRRPAVTWGFLRTWRGDSGVHVHRAAAAAKPTEPLTRIPAARPATAVTRERMTGPVPEPASASSRQMPRK